MSSQNEETDREGFMEILPAFILDCVCRIVCGGMCVCMCQELCFKGLSYQSFSDALQPVLKHAASLNWPSSLVLFLSQSHTHKHALIKTMQNDHTLY